jgi:hypothetical protein
VKDEERRVTAIVTANADPLLDPANPGKKRFVDTGSEVDYSGVSDLAVAERSEAEGGAQEQEHEKEDPCDRELRDFPKP